ncbi:MAG: response regulator [Holophagaceae bacterium]|nr:response regulator [Holophagaceae bacterium]
MEGTSAVHQAKVLVVEDAPINVDIVLGLLGQDPSLTLSVARTGGEALAAVRTSPPDLILLDIGLPDLDGYTVCQSLKADPQSQRIPVIFLTSREEPEDVARGFEAGGVDYITKPFEPLELKARVDCHLAQKRWADAERALIAKLEAALAEVKTLSGLIPICAWCKQVRDDQGFWQQVERYMADRTDANFTHSVCPNCLPKLKAQFEEGG